MKGGQISAYPEYTGTALLSFFNTPADKLPKDPQQAYELAKSNFEKDGLTAFPPTPFTDSNEVAVTKATADKLGLKNISDLSSHAGDLVLYGTPECRQRMDCLLGLEQIYGLKFKKFVPVARSAPRVLSSGRADVSIDDRPADQAQRRGPARGRQGHVPALQLDARDEAENADKAGPDLTKTLDLLQKPRPTTPCRARRARRYRQEGPAEVARNTCRRPDWWKVTFKESGHHRGMPGFLRGVTHFYAFWCALAAAGTCLRAPAVSRAAAAVYGAGLCAVRQRALSPLALAPRWRPLPARRSQHDLRLHRRLYTPVGLLVLHGARVGRLIVVWAARSAASLGVAWITAPRALAAACASRSAGSP